MYVNTYISLPQDGAKDEINIRRPKFNLVSIFANTQQHSGFKHKFTGKNNIE